MVVFVYYPIIQTFYYSLHDYKLTRPDQIEFVMFDNYSKALQDPAFIRALINTLLILALVIFVGLIMSLFIGLLLNVKTRLSPALTAIAIIPWALPPLVNGIIWSFIFHPDHGMLNKIFHSIGLIESPIRWTFNRWIVLIIVALVVAWRVIPFCSVLILSSLQGIPADLYEASAMDGAKRRKTFFSITLPLLTPTLLIVLTQLSIAALSAFDEIIALVNYRQDVQSLLIYNYQNTFSFLDFGFGSAVTYIIMIITGIFGYFYVNNMVKEM